MWPRTSFAALSLALLALPFACSHTPADVPPADAGVPDVGRAEVAEPAGSWDTPFPWKLGSPTPCPVAIDPKDALGRAVAATKLDLATLGIPKSLYDRFGGRLAADPTRLAMFHHLQEHPTEIPCFSGNLALRADLALSSDHPIATRVADAAASLALSLTVGGALPNADASDPLMAALEAAHGGAGWDRDAARAEAAAVPPAVQRAAARVILAAIEAAAIRERALSALLAAKDRKTAFERGTGFWLSSKVGAVDPESPAFQRLFRRSADTAVLYEGGVKIAQALDEIRWDEVATATPFRFRAPTPLGLVLLSGGADDTYDPSKDASLGGDVLLALDTGGNDTWRIAAGANTSANNPVSVLVDLGGDDLYAYVEVPGANDRKGLLPSDKDGRFQGDASNGPFSYSQVARQGAGVLGYGMLLDRGRGKDRYRSLRKSQGFANFGVGVLWDDGGDDDYEGEAGVQGSALVGVALLHDGDGNDTYRAFQSAQGFGSVSSFGTLYDAAGDDRYELVVDEVLLYASPQLPGRANSSLGQGTAFGLRRDQNGMHLGGGLAMLRDRRGNDSYVGATFVQGTGYWMGLGVLADREGDDQYDGMFYAQGATAHFALAAFLEGGGDDRYNQRREPVHSAIGLAHDFSVTFFVEGGGRDTYRGPDRSIGATKCHGLSLFVDLGGDDSYTALHDRAIGWATDYDGAPGSCGDSTTLPSYAFFADTGGADTYRKPDAAALGDGKLWITDDLADTDAKEYSAGVDEVAGVCFARAY